MGKLFLLFSVVFFTQFLYSQNKHNNNTVESQLNFYLLDVEEGLSNNYINDIEQDTLGFIWVGTIDGLNRYDGSKFQHYKKNYKSTGTGLQNNHIKQIELNLNGDLLLATDSGLSTYLADYESFNSLLDYEKLIDKPINCFTYGPNQELICGMVRAPEGVHIINKEQKLESYKSIPNDKNSLSSNHVSSLTMQGDSVLWVGTFDRGLNKLDFKTRVITRISYEKNQSISSSSVNSLYTDQEGNVWIGSKDGMYVITTTGDTLSLKSSANVGNGLTDNNVLAFEEDDNGQIWIGTRNGGLNIINKSQFLNNDPDFYVKWYLPKLDGTSVFNRTVSSIKKDKNGNMWIGTSTGLNYVNPKGEPVILLKRDESSTETLGHMRIGSLAESKDGKIWVGTDGGGLDLFNPNTSQFKHYRHKADNPASLSNNYVISLLEDTSQRLWVGTYHGGLNRLDNQKHIFKKYLQGTIEEGSDVRKIFEDSNGIIWVGTNRGGLYKYIEKEDDFQYIETLGKIDVRDIKQGKKNHLWLATFGDGIISYDVRANNSTSYKSENTDYLPTDVIFCIQPLSDGTIMVGTRYSGLLFLDPESRKTTGLTEREGLSNNTICSMVMDSNNKVWLSTFNSVDYYDIATKTIHNLKNQNNLQQGEFNIGAAISSSSGLLYFGGNKGLNIINPAQLNRIVEKHSIILESLNVLNKPVPITPKDNNSGILNKSIAYQHEIVLNHNQTLFSVDFTLLKFPVAKNVSYSYFLDGHHTHWIDNKNIGTATLSNIPPGNYVLKMKAEVGPETIYSKDLRITLTPPLWKTWPAYLLYFIVLLGLTLGVMKYYSVRIKLKNSLLYEKKQRQLEHDLNEERIRFFTNFSHELKTPLTLILAPVEDLISQINDKKQLMSIKLIQKNAKYLFQTINKLLEFRKSEVDASDIVVGRYNLNSCLKHLVENYIPLSKKRHIKLIYSSSDDTFMAWFDLEKLQIVVNNLLSNAFKHTPNNGTIEVITDYDNSHFNIKVKDSGSGVHPKDLPHIFEWYYQSGKTTKKKGSGIGLAFSKNLIELHKGEILVSTQMNEGTIFTVSVPRNKSLFANKVVKQSFDFVEKEDVSASNIWGPTILESSLEEKHAQIELDKNREVLLLIDDNPDILQYLQGLLSEDYDIIFAENGKKGIDKSLHYVPDLIISDIMMPKKSGIDLCGILKKNISTTHIPIILLSAKDNHESIMLGFEEGADDYIIKPFNGQILKSRVKNLLENRKNLRTYFQNLDNSIDDLTDKQATLFNREKKFLKSLEKIILENLSNEDVSVDTIAQDIGMSRSSLFRKLKAITGHNINEYIRMVRINKAASLIKNEGFTIAQATYEVGYSSVKYFRKHFKEQYGELPSSFQKKMES
ncbi:two-component regulator propeller domain-containing protein [Arenibacter sp. ARW7G5Y1]|uniref:hybrid sensor histidine kinase/response regulator transcription factor n=1 Tax=Arenibacter sp. ARW7G5Y1 TaxID=2135619 RepID=UPI000D77597D|nr:two-component regulator propeller domain-containing protein [Arenibacter sp. ARW7G5Y1]